jgi:hydroxymethylglutaryl-CoA synthase
MLAIDPESGLHAEDVMDFWRPNYRDEAWSTASTLDAVYLASLVSAWSDTGTPAGADWCLSAPLLPPAVHAHRGKGPGAPAPRRQPADADAGGPAPLVGDSLGYTRVHGNTYAASLYEGLTCLLTRRPRIWPSADRPVQLRIRVHAEFFSGVVQAG